MQSERIARGFVTASFVGLSIAWIIWSIGGFSLSDADAYRQAADRLLAGEDLYVQAETQDEAFRYAPWFAAAWVPLAQLPEWLANTIWAAALVAASIASVFPLARIPSRSARLLAILGGTMLLWTAARGNVHPLVMAALIFGLPRRSGPVWLALAASLKAVPLMFVLVYLANHDWRKAAAAILLFALLVAPMPLVGWDLASVDPGGSLSLYSLVSPELFVGAAALTVALAIWLAVRQSPFVPIASAVAAIALLPRLLLYDLTYVLVEAHHGSAPRGRAGLRR